MLDFEPRSDGFTIYHLIDADERTCLPDRVCHETAGTQRRYPLHRRVLQQPTTALSARLSQT